MNLLIVNASARLARSHTRELARIFEAAFLSERADVEVVQRDVARHPIPHIDEAWIEAAFTPPNQRTATMAQTLAVSDKLIDEVEAADIIVIATPMYNYNLPASLKAWIDMVARVGRTFSFDLERGDQPIEPSLTGKTLVVLSSAGEFGFHPGGPRAHLNALDVGFRACAHYLGAHPDEIQRVAIEYQEFKDERWRRSVDAARTEVDRLARRLATDSARHGSVRSGAALAPGTRST